MGSLRLYYLNVTNYGVHAVIGAGHPISVVITRLYVYPSYLIIGVFLLKNEVAYSFNMQLHCMQLVTG